MLRSGPTNAGRSGESPVPVAILEPARLDVEGILAFAERILPRASDLWVQGSLDYRQRLQELFFSEGIAFDGIRFDRTAATALLFKYLEPDERADEKFGVPPAIELELAGATWLEVVEELQTIARAVSCAGIRVA
jgi:hypothetical protein